MAIPHSRPSIDGIEMFELEKAMKKGEIASGANIGLLEKELAQYVGRSYAKGTNSGSNAIFITLKALGIGKGDEVIMPSYVCNSVWMAITNAGALPVLADVEPGTPNISKETIKPLLTSRTKAIVAPHLLGLVSDIQSIVSIGIPVIEDCAMAIGADIGENKVGSYGTASIFSFYSNKMLAGGRGGMVATDNVPLYNRIKDMLKYSDRESLSECYSMSLDNLTATLALSQLKKLDGFVQKRRELAMRYDEMLTCNELSHYVMKRPEGSIPYRYVIDTRGSDIDSMIKYMDDKGIACRRPVFRPIHKYNNEDSSRYMVPMDGLPNTDYAYMNLLSIPMYPSMNEMEAAMVVDWLTKCVKRGR